MEGQEPGGWRHPKGRRTRRRSNASKVTAPHSLPRGRVSDPTDSSSLAVAEREVVAKAHQPRLAEVAQGDEPTSTHGASQGSA